MIAEILIATITAYSQLDTCPDRDCKMASGRYAYEGAVACPRRIALGTKIIIDGKEYFCEDRTSKKKDGVFDIWTGYGQEGYRNAVLFGKKKKKIIVCK